MSSQQPDKVTFLSTEGAASCGVNVTDKRTFTGKIEDGTDNGTVADKDQVPKDVVDEVKHEVPNDDKKVQWTGTYLDIVRRVMQFHGGIDAIEVADMSAGDTYVCNRAGHICWVGTFHDGTLKMSAIPTPTEPLRIHPSEVTFAPVTGNEFFFMNPPPSRPSSDNEQMADKKQHDASE
jgi:hypothetical protein